MSAHNGNGDGPAHDSPVPENGKTKRVQVDSSGISMDWRVAGALILLLTGSGGVTLAQIFDKFGVATTGDVSEHNDDKKSHRVPGTEKGIVEFVLDQDAAQKDLVSKVEGIETKVKGIETKVNNIDTNVTDQKNTSNMLKKVVFDFRAEELSDKAAESIRDPERSREVANRVRERALRNLEDEKPVREGLEDYLR